MLPEFIDSLRQMEIILKDGSYYEIEKEDLIAWSRTYKDCNVIYEIRAAAEWCEANPSRRKTLRGIRRFINAWLSKANKLKGSPPLAARTSLISLSDFLPKLGVFNRSDSFLETRSPI